MFLTIKIDNEDEFKKEIRKAIMAEIKSVARAEGSAEFDAQFARRFEKCVESMNIQNLVNNAVERHILKNNSTMIQKAINAFVDERKNDYASMFERKLNGIENEAIMKKVEEVLKANGLSLLK